jgi:hypothetical protein
VHLAIGRSRDLAISKALASGISPSATSRIIVARVDATDCQIARCRRF